MPRKTLYSLEMEIDIIRNDNNQLRGTIHSLNHRIELLTTELRCKERIERRFDQLLEGMCIGMKEANLPRRAS